MAIHPLYDKVRRDSEPWYIHMPLSAGGVPGRVFTKDAKYLAWIPVPWDEAEEKVGEEKVGAVQRLIGVALAEEDLVHINQAQTEELLSDLRAFARGHGVHEDRVFMLLGVYAVKPRQLVPLLQSPPPEGVWLGIGTAESETRPPLCIRTSAGIYLLASLGPISPPEYAEEDIRWWLP